MAKLMPDGALKLSAYQSLRSALIPWVTALVIWPCAAYSQVAPSQVTPQTLRPAAPSAPIGAPPSASEPVRAPEGADKLNFVVGRVAIEGGFPELAAETRSLAATIEGHRVSVAQIYDFANKLEQAYAREGYVLVRVTVPPQQLKDRGDLKILVIDGFIEKIQLDGLPENVRKLIERRMGGIVNRKHMKLEELERRLLLTSNVPGLRLKSTLARGTVPGGTLIVLEGAHHYVTGGFSDENRLASNLGTWMYGGNVALNSAFGFGEQFYYSALSSGDLNGAFGDEAPLLVLGSGAVIPLGNDGWIVNPEYTYSRSMPEPEFGGLENIGRFERYALRSSYPVIETRSKTLTVNAGYEHISQSVELPLFETDLSDDNYSVLRMGAAFETGLPWWGATLQTTGTFSQGLGGRDEDDALESGIPLSRLGSSPDFHKINVDATFAVPLPQGLRLVLLGRTQGTFGDPVFTSEQLTLDGPQSLSGFDSGDISVDEGGVIRAELSRGFVAPGFKQPLILSPYVFAAYGAGRLNEPVVGEIPTIEASSYGFGLRTSIDSADGYRGLALAFELAEYTSNLPDIEDGWRGNVGINFKF